MHPRTGLPQPADYACKVPKRTEPSFFGRVGKTAISTLVTVGVWSAITWKPIGSPLVQRATKS